MSVEGRLLLKELMAENESHNYYWVREGMKHLIPFITHTNDKSASAIISATFWRLKGHLRWPQDYGGRGMIKKVGGMMCWHNGWQGSLPTY